MKWNVTYLFSYYSSNLRKERTKEAPAKQMEEKARVRGRIISKLLMELLILFVVWIYSWGVVFCVLWCVLAEDDEASDLLGSLPFQNLTKKTKPRYILFPITLLSLESQFLHIPAFKQTIYERNDATDMSRSEEGIYFPF